ncbi:AbrB/MazE/SpoVT family DNA-binding domain-containing protein [Alicyclobacillus fastidiosus]|uniref:AbrB/MazE/SpoVT family DNA-binding domain-containing protein n=1 Tax=Alicyclobacillus fastidiosus TaxID=392011 RepID=UPI0034D635BB
MLLLLVHSKVTRAGQITIPKALREDIGLNEGDYVELIRVPEGILLKPKTMKLVDLEPKHKK